MCGICGFASPSNGIGINTFQVLTRMNRILVHRGPDDEGFFYDEHVGLGSRRLSIIDLAGGKQPIHNEDSSCWIVLNGEIYNYRELRVFLIKRGHEFTTQTDTEVLIHLYEEFGMDCVQHIDGMFAFAIWDCKERQLVLARDHMGIKPLYYTFIKPGTLVFGSEMKVILSHPDVEREIDLISLNEYLSYEYVPAPRTIIHNVFRVEAGQLITFNSKGLTKNFYKQLSFVQAESKPPVDWRDYASLLYKNIEDSVKRELVSDVPVGVLLSGGIDSSTIASMMVKHYPEKVQSFTIGFEDTSFDEAKYARKVAKYLGTDHNEMILTSKQAVDLIKEIPEFLDEPFADSSFIPTFLLSRFANQKVKVVLGGDGGDELFGGYPTLQAHKVINIYERIIPWFMRAYIAPKILDKMAVSFNNISFDFKIRRLLDGRNVPLIDRHQRWLGSFYDEEKALLLQDWIKPVLRDTFYQSYEYSRFCDARLAFNKILFNDQKLYLEGDILYKVDRASMANSLEVRVPFLNRSVLENANQIPFNLKLRGFSGKYILKKAMSNSLPKEILNRPKKGFNMPVAKWLTKDLQPMMMDLLSIKKIQEQGFFNTGYVKTLIDDHLTHTKDNRKLLWTLFIFQLWYSKLNKK